MKKDSSGGQAHPHRAPIDLCTVRSIPLLSTSMQMRLTFSCGNVTAPTAFDFAFLPSGTGRCSTATLGLNENFESNKFHATNSASVATLDE